MNLKKVLQFMAVIIISGCSEGERTDIEIVDELKSNTLPIDKIVVPEGFNYEMTKEVNIDLRFTLANGDSPQSVKIKIYNDKPSMGGKLIQSVMTDKSGYYKTTIKVPVHIKRVYVTYDYIGAIEGEWLHIDGNYTQYERDSFSYIGKKLLNNIFNFISKKVYAYYAPLSDIFTYPGTYDSQGVPDYLESEDDIITLSFLDDINSSLPEKKPVPEYHPDFIAEGVNANTTLLEEAEVWVTFVHEGAGFKNVLGYYTYNKNNPPQSKSDLTDMKIIFPNASYQNSGGGLSSGNKVFLGTFPIDTVIGYFLIADGWNSYLETNSDGQRIYYSNPDFNPENKSSKRAHNVMLWDSERELLLLGFEDLYRNGGSDDDFNDAVFFLTVLPGSAVDTTGLSEIDRPIDSDGDGINDLYDEYPNDVERAFNNYYPSENTNGTLAFEDLWPNKGDYDFNDFVTTYNFRYVTNSELKIVDIYADFSIKAVGAGYRNGFGFEIPVPFSTVASVSGSSINENYITLNSNGTENGNQNVVIIVCDNVYKVIDKPSGYMVNTQQEAPYVNPVTLSISIHFDTPVSISESGLPPFNPFIIANLNRGNEIHLPGKKNTELSDSSLFGTQDDTSLEDQKYYITENNLPWGLNIPYEFNHLKERESIDKGHLKFKNWAITGGLEDVDWYVDKTGHRNLGKLYEVP